MRNSGRPAPQREMRALDFQLQANSDAYYRDLIEIVKNAAPALNDLPELNENIDISQQGIRDQPIVSAQDARSWLEECAKRIDLRRIGYLESSTERLTARQLAQKIFDAQYVWYYRNPTEYDSTVAGQNLFTASRKELENRLEQAIRIIEGKDLDSLMYTGPTVDNDQAESLNRPRLLSRHVIGTLETGRFPHSWAAVRFMENLSQIIGEDFDLSRCTLEQVLEKSIALQERASSGEFSELEEALEAEQK